MVKMANNFNLPVNEDNEKLLELVSEKLTN